MVEVTRLERGGQAWDRFVEQHPAATVAHLAAWGSVIHRAYGHESVCLVAEKEGDIAGVLPLVLIRSWLFGHRLVSMPFLDYGGILAEAGSACSSCATATAGQSAPPFACSSATRSWSRGCPRCERRSPSAPTSRFTGKSSASAAAMATAPSISGGRSGTPVRSSSSGSGAG